MIYEVLLANTLDRTAIFSGYSYLESTSTLSDIYKVTNRLPYVNIISENKIGALTITPFHIICLNSYYILQIV